MLQAHLLDPNGVDKNRLEQLFEKLYEGDNCILFLGAGASITDKKYLSKDVIEYYKNKLGIDDDTTDIVEFVDNLSSNSDFKRKDFDQYVYNLLNKLHITDAHKAIMSIRWRQILTTNFDLLLERAEQELEGSSEKAFNLYPVRSIKEYEYLEDREQVKYIKLNGCMSDMGKFPFVFSSNDFTNANRFYKKVLNNLKGVSPNITFLSIGYSFSDPLAKTLLSKFDKYNYRDRKWIYNIDPFVSEYKLNKLLEDRICVIKITISEFFKLYKEWEVKKNTEKAKTKGIKILTPKNEGIRLSPKLSLNLSGYIEQLSKNYSGRNINEKDFYLGEEPNFNVIINNFDIIKESKILELSKTIVDILNEPKASSMIPLVLLTGNFGTGKTTFTYRVLNEICSNQENNTIAFELKDLEALQNKPYLIIELLENIGTKNIIFYTNDLETDSIYKAFLELRLHLSQEQITNKNICFISSIRENSLEILRRIKNFTNAKELNIDTPLNEDEIDVFLNKLKSNGLINFRDVHEKKIYKEKILKSYKGDTYVALLDIITDGQHKNDLLGAYYALPSEKCREAFIYTALFHRFNLLTPASLLKNLIATNWEDFTTTILKVEGKGILIQEQLLSKGGDPDLYFRTKHRVIAEKLIQEILKNENKKFRLYKNIFSRFNSGPKFSRLAINLFKSLIEIKEFDDFQLNQLFDDAYQPLQDDPHFLLHYSKNLQFRLEKKSLEKALKHLLYAESLLPHRNPKFIHRRGVINFELAKLYYKEEKELEKTYIYLDEAEELFALKQIIDPSSSYSYTDYIYFIIWKIENVKIPQEEIIQYKIKIEDYLHMAFNVVNDNINKIQECYENYNNRFQYSGDTKRYLAELEALYENLQLRPFVCILMYNYYINLGDNENAQIKIEELKYYDDNESVLIFLLRYYGRRLHIPNNRISFHKISNTLSNSKIANTLRYYYFNYIVYAYDKYFSESEKYLSKINSRYPSINPEFNLKWLDSEFSENRIFEGSIVRNGKGKFKFKSQELQKSFRIIDKGKITIKEGDKCFAEIHFHINGIFAVIINLSI